MVANEMDESVRRRVPGEKPDVDTDPRTSTCVALVVSRPCRDSVHGPTLPPIELSTIVKRTAVTTPPCGRPGSQRNKPEPPVAGRVRAVPFMAKTVSLSVG